MMPRSSPSSTTEHRLTLGTFERDRLEQFLTHQQRDRTLESALDVTKAALQPVGLLLASFIAYQGMIHWASGVDGLKNRFTEAPVGQTLSNVRRLNPAYRFITWSLGGENPPLIKPEEKEAVADAVSAAVDSATITPDEARDAATGYVGLWAQLMGNLFGYR